MEVMSIMDMKLMYMKVRSLFAITSIRIFTTQCLIKGSEGITQARPVMLVKARRVESLAFLA